MKFLLTLFSLLVVAIGTSYGSLATSYQADVAQYGGRRVDGGWILVDCRNGTFALYKIDNGVVEAAICYLPMGISFPEWGVWTLLPKTCDRAGQRWVHYDNDASGNPEYGTNDGRLYAKTFWLGGYNVLRICYAQFEQSPFRLHPKDISSTLQRIAKERQEDSLASRPFMNLFLDRSGNRS